MRNVHRFLICLSLAVLVTVAPAQQAAQPEAAPEPRTPAIIDQIPDEALGFLVISDLQGMSDNINQFLGAMQLPFPMPPGGMLASVQMMFGLGPGFDPSGGMAIVLLDPEPFGVDLDFDLPGPLGDTEALDDADADEDDEPTLWPLVFFVPGDGVQGVFGNSPSTAVGNYTQLEMPMATAFATYRDGYVLVSPRADALDAILAQSGRLADDLSDGQRQALTESDLAVHVDATRATPLVRQAFDKMFEAYQTMLQMAEAETTDTQIAGFRMGQDAMLDLVEQMQAGTMTLSFRPEGMHGSVAMAMDPDSDLGLALASLDFRPSPVPNRVPDFPYAVAVAANVDYTDEIASVLDTLEQTALASLPSQWAVPDEQLAELRTIRTELGRQITGVQYVVGAGAEGEMKIAMVMACADSEQMMTLIRQGVESELALLEDLQAREDNAAEDIHQIELAYEQDATTIDGVSVDTMHLTYPVSAEAPGALEEMMMGFFGDGELSVMLGAPDAETVVATFGDQDIFTSTLATCDGTSPIPVNAEVAQAMAVVPGDARLVGLINLKNAMQFSDAVAADFAEAAPAGMMMMQGNALQYMETDMPIVFYVQTEDSTLRTTMFMPIETLRDAMQSSMRYMMEQMQQQMESGSDEPQNAPENDTGF